MSPAWSLRDQSTTSRHLARGASAVVWRLNERFQYYSGLRFSEQLQFYGGLQSDTRIQVSGGFGLYRSNWMWTFVWKGLVVNSIFFVWILASNSKERALPEYFRKTSKGRGTYLVCWADSISLEPQIFGRAAGLKSLTSTDKRHRPAKHLWLRHPHRHYRRWERRTLDADEFPFQNYFRNLVCMVCQCFRYHPYH